MRFNREDVASDGNTTGGDILEGKTLKVYRYLFKVGRPQGIRDIQRGLNFSSPSVAEYHVKKLLSMGLIVEVGPGYVVDKNILGNMIRIKRRLIPYQVGYVAFFGAALFILATFFRSNFFDLFWFSLAVVSVALVASVLESIRSLKREL
jgi:DNA-binding Lrp family transcriptional regulator